MFIDDIRLIENDLLSAIVQEFTAHNTIIDKKQNWTLPKTLTFSQIGQIISTIFGIKCICCIPQNNNPAHDILGLYIDDYITQILGDAYEKKHGVYITDDLSIERLSQFFNSDISIHKLEEIKAWLKRNVDHVRRCEDKDLIAVNN